MRQVTITFDTLFTLARNYAMNALHDIECIYHQYLVSMTDSSKAEEGIDSVRPLSQLVDCANNIFNDIREVIFYLFRRVVQMEM